MNAYTNQETTTNQPTRLFNRYMLMLKLQHNNRELIIESAIEDFYSLYLDGVCGIIGARILTEDMLKFAIKENITITDNAKEVSDRIIQIYKEG